MKADIPPCAGGGSQTQAGWGWIPRLAGLGAMHSAVPMLGPSVDMLVGTWLAVLWPGTNFSLASQCHAVWGAFVSWGVVFRGSEGHRALS